VLALDRPERLNALDLSMIRTMSAQLDAWREDARVACILLRSTSPRAFCAGGDIRLVHASSLANDGESPRFWTEQYRLDVQLARYPKPVIAFMNGITMGGGVGLGSHVRFRIVDETTTLAMPEVGIGLIPDVGGTWLLSRGPGECGTYLALSGASIGAADAIALGLADYVVPVASHDALAAALGSVTSSDDAAIVACINRFAVSPPPTRLSEHRESIDRAFAHDSVEAILAALRAEDSAFTLEAAATIGSRSPMSLKLTLRALREARPTSSVEAAIVIEYRLMCRRLHDADVCEGIRAAVIDKDRRPTWSPAALEAISDGDVEAYFRTLGSHELELPLH